MTLKTLFLEIKIEIKIRFTSQMSPARQPFRFTGPSSIFDIGRLRFYRIKIMLWYQYYHFYRWLKSVLRPRCPQPGSPSGSLALALLTLAMNNILLSNYNSVMTSKTLFLEIKIEIKIRVTSQMSPARQPFRFSDTSSDFALWPLSCYMCFFLAARYNRVKYVCLFDLTAVILYDTLIYILW